MRPSKSKLYTTLARLLNAMEKEIDGFAHPPGGGRATSNLVRRASVPPAFVDGAIEGARSVPSLSALNVLDPVDASAVQQRISDLEMIESLTEQFLRGLRFTIQRDRASLGSKALTLYTAGQALANDPARDEILPFLKRMRELLHKKNRQRAQVRRRRVMRKKEKA
ncbi:MAG TPA: hypothetical protein VGF48_07070 [Thermoanaerobaculia bacterium]